MADANALHGSNPALPYKIACLCDLRDEQGRILLLRRLKAPNLGLCSPIGGKLDIATGESPAQCAQREILEEAGLDIPMSRIHLLGLVSEREFEGKGHWLMFVYRVLGPVWVEPFDMREGRLDWFHPHEVAALPLPETDRKIIWPLINAADGIVEGSAFVEPAVPGFFAVNIDCRGPAITWTIEQQVPPIMTKT
jgi:8-oxo-dGTP diphosphatase